MAMNNVVMGGPKGQRANSPGQRPGYWNNPENNAPKGQKQLTSKFAFALTGRHKYTSSNTQGVALGWWLLPLRGVNPSNIKHDSTMRKAIFVAILTIVTAIGAKAQNLDYSKMETLNDSISVMFQHLARTNAELDYLNECVRLHSQIALGSFVLEGIGVACLWWAPTDVVNGLKERDSMTQLGLGLCLAGGIAFICSYIPLWTRKIKIDKRGLVIPID